MNKDKSAVISNITSLLLEGNKMAAQTVICQEYPHEQVEIEKRAYTMAQKMNQFISDGFIDRYSGQKLLNPGILKVLSCYFPEEFPYHPHWKMTHTHIAYWEDVYEYNNPNGTQMMPTHNQYIWLNNSLMRSISALSEGGSLTQTYESDFTFGLSVGEAKTIGLDLSKHKNTHIRFM